MLEGLLANHMLNPAGVPFCRFRVYAGFNQPVGKEAVLFVDPLRHFLAHIGQVQKIVAVHLSLIHISSRQWVGWVYFFAALLVNVATISVGE